MRALDAGEIVGSFVNCSARQAKTIAGPAGLADLDWDCRDFLGWRDPKAPMRGYLVLVRDDRAIGLVLRAPSSTAAHRGSALCNLCLTAHPAGGVTLFVAPRAGAAGRAGNTLGTYICTDLACSLNIRGLRRLELPQGESVSVPERVERLGRRLGAFVDRVVGPQPRD